VDTCENGEEALRKNAETAYELIVTDMKLPGLDGLSLIKRLKAANSETDVIVITGYGSIENAVECMRAGALDYIIKPFTINQIQMALKKALDHRELRRRAIAMELYRELSYLDPLTGIHNRRFFDEALETEIQKANRLSMTLVLVMIDIDDFKLYNDSNGHQKGDAALVKIAQLFKSACRASDIVARYGGEEFVIIFPGAGQEHAMELSRRIVQEVAAADFDGQNLVPSGSLTVSIGVACFPEHAGSASALIQCADQALYEAKKHGKNTIRLWSQKR
jgi:diguanylate cyclase (GGDEF)-like protein